MFSSDSMHLHAVLFVYCDLHDCACDSFVSTVAACDSYASTIVVQAGTKRKAESDITGGPQKKHAKDEALAFLEETMQGLAGGES